MARTVPAPDLGPTAIREVDPYQCGNGHPWATDGSWRRGWMHCTCAGGTGHRTWAHGCGAPTIYDPPHDPTWQRQTY